MEIVLFNSVAILCVLVVVVVGIIDLSKGNSIESRTFLWLIAAAGAYSGGSRAKKKITELKKHIREEG